MSKIEFYKATSSGGLDPIENSTSSLHYRRSIIIKDDISDTLWLIHGSGVANATKQSAENNIKKINQENDGKYVIEHVDYDDAKDVIGDVLALQDSSPADPPELIPRRKVSLDNMPKVPKINSSTETEAPRPLGDQDHHGPEIEEFQISYFVEEETDTAQESSPLIKQVLEVVSKYIEEIDTSLQGSRSRKESQSILHDLSDDIITLIYS